MHKSSQSAALVRPSRNLLSEVLRKPSMGGGGYHGPESTADLPRGVPGKPSTGRHHIFGTLLGSLLWGLNRSHSQGGPRGSCPVKGRSAAGHPAWQKQLCTLQEPTKAGPQGLGREAPSSHSITRDPLLTRLNTTLADKGELLMGPGPLSLST